MATTIRPELSKKNKYWISKHRHYELKHFCLQYPTWKKKYLEILDSCSASIISDIASSTYTPSDLTAKYALQKIYYSEKIAMIEKAAMEADRDLYIYILKAVTENLSYTYLKTRFEMPCSKDRYYSSYRKFFYLLSKERG